MLIELKKRGENLQKHYRQAFDYWTQNRVQHRRGTGKHFSTFQDCTTLLIIQETSHYEKACDD